MSGSPFQSSLLARDRKLFLDLTQEEADLWITRVFDRVRPNMQLISAVTLQEDDEKSPLNLEVVLMVANRSVREVSIEMADALLTPERQKKLMPLISRYCDELLAQGRELDAAFVQQGLIDILQGVNPSQNTLLVEICLRSIYHQVSILNNNTPLGARAL